MKLIVTIVANGITIGQYLSVGDEIQLVWCVGEGREVRRCLATLFNDIVVCLCVGKRGRGRVGRGVERERGMKDEREERSKVKEASLTIKCKVSTLLSSLYIPGN